MDDIMPLGKTRSFIGVTQMRDLAKISVEVAIGLRVSLANNGIRQIADYVNGIVFAGLLLQKNYRPMDGEVSFSGVFEAKIAQYVELMSRDEFAEHRQAMNAHKIGITDQPPTEMLVTSGLAAEGTITTIAEEYDLSKADVMDLVTAIVALAVTASTPPEKMDMILAGMAEGVREKTKAWDEMIPSDEEMFGDFDLDDDED